MIDRTHALVLTLAALVAVAAAGLPAQAVRGEPDQVAAVVDNLCSAWSRGGLQLDGPAVQGGRTHPAYKDLLGPALARDGLQNRRAFAAVFDRAADVGTPRAAAALVEFVATTIEPGMPAELSAGVVRSMLLDAAARLRAPSAIDAVIRLAAGDDDVAPRRRHRMLRPAAVLVLGQIEHPVARRPAEAALADEERTVRLAAAEALLTRGDANSADAIASALHRETDPGVAKLLTLSLERALRVHAEELGPARVRRALSIALETLGRHGWRVDVVIVEMCAQLRSRDAIPALVGVLDRIRKADDPRAFGFLRERTHTVLRSLTGAILPADDPDAWQAFWESEKDKLEVPKNAGPYGDDDTNRTTTGFFGIPVHGQRVVFLIDISGSMQAAHPLPQHHTSTGRGIESTRLGAAKVELIRAIEGLPEDAHFNVIAFESRIDPLFNEMQPANSRVRSRVRDRVARLHASGGTNIWGALKSALDLRELSWGDTELPEVDEVFLLSDGAPSAGELTNANDIEAAVREANRLKGVRIHTIYLGASDSGFMQRLADENGGRYVRSD